MAVRRVDCRVHQVDPDTPGGDTFHILLPGKRQPKKICYRQRHGDPEMICINPAGYGTWHVGTGACKFHGGCSGRNPNMKSGKYARVTKMRLEGSIEKYLNEDRSKLLDLTYELAATKAMFNEFLERFPDPNDEEYGIWFNRFTTAIGTLGSLVEKINKIETRNTLTTAQVLYLRATIVDLMMKYIPDIGVREQAARELAARLGGDIEVEMKASEYTLPGKIV